MNFSQFFVRIFLVVVLTLAPGCKRQYYSRARVEYGGGPVFGRAAADADAEKVIRDLLPKGDDSVRLERIRNTNLYDIGVYSHYPKAAADRANQLAVEMGTKLNPSPDAALFKIWEKAEPSLIAK